ncbi:Polyserase-2-like protein, partial [Dinothrombium tinctorium]
IVRHPNYESQNYSNDIALIKMDEPIDFAGSESHLKPACLDLRGLIEKNLDNQTRCVATGFGELGNSNSSIPNVLQQLDMKLFDHDECVSLYHNLSQIEVTDKQFCMVSKHNPQPLFGNSYGAGCKGDSGGPLQCFINNNWIHLGVIARIIDCERHPTVFQKIYKYAEFIENTSCYKLPTSCELHSKC